MPQKPIKPKNLSRLKTYFKDQLSTLTISLAAAHLRATMIYCFTSTGAEMSKRVDDSGSEEEDCTEPSNSSEEYQGRQQSMC